jgi:hypothetical protein
MHRFIGQVKSFFASGIQINKLGLLKIAKIDSSNNRTVYFINLNSFYYTLNKSITFAKIVYDDTISYIFPHFDNGLSSITLPKNDTNLQ